ncbi:tetratricopeptide repeat protein [Sphingomonas sanxanigenens]|uniref:Tetratricopeptide repeat protein 38 n=1 Tax=Sphingomonas sanxanigenens DSM 19645 = NX02 TaxID=1123269 RepID=W0AJ12_9SPHN|nr:tetratricopeptide repeat protein [Sphingomonas sanxanigenens]AHE57111.1 hypothetical protein NX02_27635 [Sphingomonas sanxanigenens DSM 19645 = NX02]
MKTDRYGNPISTPSPTAIARYDEALDLIRLYHGDPIAALDAALTEDPRFGAAWAARAAVLVQQQDAAYLPEARRSIAEGLAAATTERDRAMLGACAEWAAGRVGAAVSGFTAIACEAPRDLLALQTAHVGHFYLGRATDLRDAPLQALRAWDERDPACHALLGMAAFGLEECGDYARAEAMGRRAVERDPRDGWAVHAVAHVYEMLGRTAEGIAWLTDQPEALAPVNGFAYHNWWHLALLHLDRGDHDAALTLYDQKVRPDPSADVMLEWIDASALLWRLWLEGVDVGDRFAPLAECWLRALDQRIYAFNDLHALMALLGAGRRAEAADLIANIARAAGGGGDNAVMAARIGLPLAGAFVDHVEGRHAAAVEAILAVRGSAQRFGGSHAQRDVLTLTAFHAAMAAGMTGTAQALAHERITHKPESAWARRLVAVANGDVRKAA